MKCLVNAVLSIVLLAFAAPNAYSCSCGGPPATPRQAFENSAAVFVGEFIGYGHARFNRKRRRAPRFRVERQWKGGLPPEIALPLLDIPGCDADLKLVGGRKYLLYASVFKGALIAPVDCSRSREIEHAGKDLEYLDRAQSNQGAER